VPVDRTQQRVDVDERLLVDPDQQLGVFGQGGQVFAEHRFQLAGVAEGELTQQCSEGGGCVHGVEQDRHPARA
jgi:hypothetical protein